MSQTKAGAQKAKKTMLEKHGEDYYVNLGRLGGKAGHAKGFFLDRELARRAGALGGHKSKRGPANPKVIHESDNMWPEVFNIAPTVEKRSLIDRIRRSK